MTNGLTKQSGRKDLPTEQLRTHCVSVRLNPAELDLLDTRRGTHQRGEALRMAALTSLPAALTVPEINLVVASDLRRSLGNLSTLSIAMRSGEYIPIDRVREEVQHLRQQLLAASPK